MTFLIFIANILISNSLILYWIDYALDSKSNNSTIGLGLGIPGWGLGLVIYILNSFLSLIYILNIIIYSHLLATGILIYIENRNIEEFKKKKPEEFIKKTTKTPKITVQTKIKQISTVGETQLFKDQRNQIRSELDTRIEEWKSIKCDQGTAESLCTGPAVYICHHCNTPLCYEHSFWIPDIEFPRFCKKEIEIFRWKMVPFIIALCVFIVFLVLGVIFFFIFLFSFPSFLALVYLILSLIFIGIHFLGFIPLKLAEELIPLFNTHFIYHKTRWEYMQKDGWVHDGFFLAVHCWDCLKEHHPEIIDETLKLVTKISQSNWFEKNMKMNNHSVVDIAQLYLDFYKWGKTDSAIEYSAWLPYAKNKGIKLKRDDRSLLYWNVIYNKSGEYELIDEGQKVALFKNIYHSNASKKYYWKRIRKYFKS